MASVLDELNELLCRERGEVEAVQELLKEIDESDPDIADSGRDALDTASWSCKGLYHRIVHLGGTPTLDSANLVEDLEDKPDTKSKIQLVCKEQKQDSSLIKSLLKRNDLDGDTRGFLEDLLRAHSDTARWCDSVLSEWKVDMPGRAKK